jgi:hypothetical protein
MRNRKDLDSEGQGHLDTQPEVDFGIDDATPTFYGGRFVECNWSNSIPMRQKHIREIFRRHMGKTLL